MKNLRTWVWAFAIFAASSLGLAQFGGGQFVPITVQQISNLGTGVATALQVAVGSVGAILVKGTSVCADLANATSYCSATVGQLPGTTTNDSASAGNVGETAIAYTKNNTTATVTITNASPAVISWTNHGLSAAGAVYFTTTGGLPTGLSVNTTYYVTAGPSLQTNSFQVSTSVDNALAGTSINTSSAGSGVHTGISGAFLATGANTNVTGVSLTAGNWKCYGSLSLTPDGTTTITQQIGSLSIASASAGAVVSTLTNGGQRWEDLASYAAGGIGTRRTVPIAPVQTKIATTGTMYLVTNEIFAVANMIAQGNVICHRIR